MEDVGCLIGYESAEAASTDVDARKFGLAAAHFDYESQVFESQVFESQVFDS